mgnify:CR=1 FL=1
MARLRSACRTDAHQTDGLLPRYVGGLLSGVCQHLVGSAQALVRAEIRGLRTSTQCLNHIWIDFGLVSVKHPEIQAHQTDGLVSR